MISAAAGLKFLIGLCKGQSILFSSKTGETVETISRISRVMRAIRHQFVSPVPKGELTIDATFAREFLEWKKDATNDLESRSDAEPLIACSRELGLDLICLPCKNTADLKPVSTRILNQTEAVANEGFFVFWVVNGTFQMATEQGDLMDLLIDIARTPETVGNRLRQLSGTVTNAVLQGIDAGANGIILADDLAYRQSTYMSPAFIERYLLPVWKLQIAKAKERDIPVFFHSDGNINGALPSIVRAGFDGLQGIEPAAGMDIFSIKKRYGDKLCLMGNIDPSLLFDTNHRKEPFDDTDRLSRDVNALLSGFKRSGGLLFGTSSGLYTGMSPQRVDLLYRLASGRPPFS